MAREMGFTGREDMQGTALMGHGPGVVSTEDRSLATIKGLFGPSIAEAIEAKGESSLRTIVSPTLQERSESIRQYLEDTLIEHIESIDDWVNVIFPRRQMEGDGYNFEWYTEEINAHAALPSGEGHAFHIMTSAKEKRVASMGRFSIGMRAHNDDLKETAGRETVTRMIANIPSAVIRAERLMALAHISRVPGLLKFMLEPQGIKTYPTIHDALSDSKNMVGMLHAEKGIYLLWNAISQYKHFDHVIVPKGLPEQIVGGSDFETEFWRTGKSAHRALADPSRQIASGMANKPTFWVLEPFQSRDISSEEMHPLRRTLRFGEYAQIDGTHLIREPHDVNVKNHLSVQIVDARKDDWATMQYLDAVRHTGRWNFSDQNGPLDPSHRDFGTRGFATYVNNIAKSFSSSSPNSTFGADAHQADLWGDTYFWRVGSYGSAIEPDSKERFFMPCERWGDQDLLYRTLEFDEQHVRRSLSALRNNLVEFDYDVLRTWEQQAELLSNPPKSPNAGLRILEDYVKKFATREDSLKVLSVGSIGPKGVVGIGDITVAAAAAAAAAAGAGIAEGIISEADLIVLRSDRGGRALEALENNVPSFVAVDKPYGFGTAWGMYIMADAARFSKYFEGWDKSKGFRAAHEAASAAWKSMKKIFDFAMKCYPACRNFLTNNALYWFKTAEMVGTDATQIQFWELMASDNAHLPTFVKTDEAEESVTDYENDDVLSSLGEFKTDKLLKKKLLFAATRVGKGFFDSMSNFTSAVDGRPVKSEHVRILAAISKHDLFKPEIAADKYFTESGGLTADANVKVDRLKHDYPTGGDFDSDVAFGTDRSGVMGRGQLIADVERDLHRAFLSILIMEGAVDPKTQLPEDNKNLKAFYEIYVTNRVNASSSIRKKRGRTESSELGGDPSRYVSGGWKSTPISFGVSWWRGYRPANGEVDPKIAVGLPSNPLVSSVGFAGAGAGAVAEGVREKRLMDARGKPKFELSGTDFTEEKRRAFGIALRDRSRDSLPLGDGHLPSTDIEPLDEMREIYHYNHVLFSPENRVFWRRDGRSDQASSSSYYEVGPMSMRMQHARRQFGDSPITLALARSFLLSEITFRSIESIVRCNGLPPVLSLALFRPFAEINTQAVIFANRSGLLLSKHADLMEGSEVASKTWEWHYSEWKGILQRDYTSIMIRPDLLLDGYKRGMNANYFDLGWTLDGDRKKRMKDDSIFVADCGANFSREDMIASADPVSVTGRYVQARFSDVRLSAEESTRLANPPQPHFPGYAWLHFKHHLHLLEEGQASMGDYATFEKLRQRSWFDGLCWRGTQRVWNDGNRGYTTKIPGNGIARDWDAPGIVDRFAGKKKLVF